MLEWLNHNKEWLFQGIGVTAIIGIAAIIKMAFTRNSAKAAPRLPPKALNFQLESAGLASEETSRLMAEKNFPEISQIVSRVSAADIHKAIEGAPPLQRDLVAKRFEGVAIHWETDLRNATQDGDFVRLMLRAKPENDMFDVWCKVKKSDYRDLGVLSYKTKIAVRGEITKADRFSVEIKDAQLTY